MIALTRLSGSPVILNEVNILWVEALPDTSIMMLGGDRVLVKESVEVVQQAVNELLLLRHKAQHEGEEGCTQEVGSP